MMTVQTVVAALGVSMAVAALFSILFPNGNIKKVGETGITVLLLLLLISPFLLFKGKTTHTGRDGEYQSAYTYSQTQIYKSAAEQCIYDTLENAGIPIESVSVSVLLSGTNEITVKQVEITASENTDISAVTQILQEKLSVPPEIVTVQGESVWKN